MHFMCAITKCNVACSLSLFLTLSLRRTHTHLPCQLPSIELNSLTFIALAARSAAAAACTVRAKNIWAVKNVNKSLRANNRDPVRFGRQDLSIWLGFFKLVIMRKSNTHTHTHTYTHSDEKINNAPVCANSFLWLYFWASLAQKYLYLRCCMYLHLWARLSAWLISLFALN